MTFDLLHPVSASFPYWIDPGTPPAPGGGGGVGMFKGMIGSGMYRQREVDMRVIMLSLLLCLLFVGGCELLTKPVPADVRVQEQRLTEFERTTKSLEDALASGTLDDSTAALVEQALLARKAREKRASVAIEKGKAPALSTTPPPEATGLISLIPTVGGVLGMAFAAGWVQFAKARNAKVQAELVASSEALGGPQDAAERELLMRIQSPATTAAVNRHRVNAKQRVAALVKEQAAKVIVSPTS